MSPAIIKLKDVWKQYQIDDDVIFTALKEITLNIEKGEFSALLGPSGSGKSTLMHIIGLLDQPSRGEIIIDGKEISKITDDQLSSLRNEFVGFVFQQFNIINKLTILENIVLPTVYARKKMKFNVRDRGMDLIERFGL